MNARTRLWRMPLRQRRGAFADYRFSPPRGRRVAADFCFSAAPNALALKLRTASY